MAEIVCSEAGRLRHFKAAIPFAFPISTSALVRMGACCETPKLPDPAKKPEAGACCSVGAAPVEKEDSFWIRLGVSLVLVGLNMILGLGVNEASRSTPLTKDAVEYWWLHGGLILAALIPVVLLGGPLFIEAFRAWFRRRITVESLFVASAVGAMASSLMSTVEGRGGAVYYDTVPLVMVIYAVGKRVGQYSRDKAFAAVADLRKTFDLAIVLKPDGSLEPTPVSAITAHDRVMVAPGGAVPVDGVILDGRGYILEAAMTGEALPVSRGPGDLVSAGTWSRDGALVIRPVGGTRRLDAILDAVEQAKTTPSRYQEQAEKIITRFFPAVMLIAGITFFGWWKLGHDAHAGLYHAMAVLLVACPCALGLATPIAVWSGLHKLSRLGLVSKHADLPGRLAAADRIVFDKTGTLSHTELALESIAVAPEFAEKSGRVFALLRAVQSRVNHPVARAFAALDCPAFELDRLTGVSVTVVPGAGIRATVTDDCGETYRMLVGEPTLVGEENARELNGLAHGQDARATAGKRVYATIDGRPSAIAVLRESFRDDADTVLRELESLGLKTAVLTGDASAKGRSIFGADTEAGLSPAEKASRIAAWKAAGETVIFVGDGLNDAAALAGADAAIAMGAGTDLARSAAHGVLTGDRLVTLPKAIALARRIDRTLKHNLYWSAGYNIAGIGLAAAGLLTPVWAALIMVISSTFVSWRAAKAAGMTEE